MPSVSTLPIHCDLALRALLHQHRERARAARLEVEAPGRCARDSNACCSASAASRCPCGSNPAARVSATSSAVRARRRRTRRRRAAAVARAGSQDSASFSNSSVGSRGSQGSRKPAAGEARSRTRSSSCARRNARIERVVIERRRQQVAVRRAANRASPSRLDLAVRDQAELAAACAAPLPVHATCRPRPAGCAPEIASNSIREAGPSPISSRISRSCGVCGDGMNSRRSDADRRAAGPRPSRGSRRSRSMRRAARPLRPRVIGSVSRALGAPGVRAPAVRAAAAGRRASRRRAPSGSRRRPVPRA